MIFRLFVFLVALALTSTSLLAGPRTVAAMPYQTAAAADLPIMSMSGKTISAAIVVSGKPCMRGALPLGSCAPDIGLPAGTADATSTALKVGFESSTSTMAGLSVGCLVGPPRFG